MQKNLTLTIDADVLKAARKLAIERDTTVNQLVRDYLADLTQQKTRREIARKEFIELCRKSKARVGTITWTRDDLHDRRL